jgi:hypothetical protein
LTAAGVLGRCACSGEASNAANSVILRRECAEGPLYAEESMVLLGVEGSFAFATLRLRMTHEVLLGAERSFACAALRLRMTYEVLPGVEGSFACAALRLRMTWGVLIASPPPGRA